MREIFHTDEEGGICPNDYDDCMFANLDAPLVRSGGEPFKSYHGDVVRVLNNPYFYRDANAPERRLVEIASVGGFRFALDRASYIAPASVLAKELALLNYGCKEPRKLDAVAERLTKEIAEVLDDWGLTPTRS